MSTNVSLDAGSEIGRSAMILSVSVILDRLSRLHIFFLPARRRAYVCFLSVEIRPRWHARGMTIGGGNESVSEHWSPDALCL